MFKSNCFALWHILTSSRAWTNTQQRMKPAWTTPKNSGLQLPKIFYGGRNGIRCWNGILNNQPWNGSEVAGSISRKIVLTDTSKQKATRLRSSGNQITRKIVYG